jgi:hypothetical protein
VLLLIAKILGLFQSKKEEPTTKKMMQNKNKQEQQRKSVRKGEIGEYKVNIQLDQMPKEYKHLADLLVTNPAAKSGYSQIDHVLLTPYAIFVIETKNYQGEIKGGRDDKQWSVNNRFTMMNPFHQNYGHIEIVRKITNAPREAIVSLISFTRRATFSVDPALRKISSNDLIVYDIELTEFIERKINYIKLTEKKSKFTAEQIDEMYLALKQAHITDPAIRALHTDSLKGNGLAAQKTKGDERAKCASCGKPVPPKVKEYCLANPGRFIGKIYCYDHQK